MEKYFFPHGIRKNHIYNLHTYSPVRIFELIYPTYANLGMLFPYSSRVISSKHG